MNCKVFLLIGLLCIASASAANYYVYQRWTANDLGVSNVYSAGGFIDYGNVLNRGANKHYLIYVSDGQADMVEVETIGDPNCHSQYTGHKCLDNRAFAQRTKTDVMSWDNDAVFQSGRGSMFVNSSGFYYGSSGSVHHFKFDGSYGGKVVDASLDHNSFAFDSNHNIFWAANNNSQVFNFVEGASSWNQEFKLPTYLGGNGVGGLAILKNKLLAAQKDSDIIFLYDLSDGTVSENNHDFLDECPECSCDGCVLPDTHFTYNYVASLTNMGEGPNYHLWATDGNIVYELGGGDFQCDLQPELCDGVDNDCDTQVDLNDDDILRYPCPNNVGACNGAKTTVCSGSAGWDECSATDYLANNASFEVLETLCDNIDNDCDGQIDEDLANNPEICDGLDNDCDGYVDEDLSLNDEVCDDIDNNCNGQIDEGFDLNSDPTNCGDCGVDCGPLQCSNGVCTTVCDDGICSPGETCNEDNCCSGYESDHLYDPMNCGGCGIECPANNYCRKGVCTTVDEVDFKYPICLSSEGNNLHCRIIQGVQNCEPLEACVAQISDLIDGHFMQCGISVAGYKVCCGFEEGPVPAIPCEGGVVIERECGITSVSPDVHDRMSARFSLSAEEVNLVIKERQDLLEKIQDIINEIPVVESSNVQGVDDVDVPDTITDENQQEFYKILTVEAINQWGEGTSVLLQGPPEQMVVKIVLSSGSQIPFIDSDLTDSSSISDAKRKRIQFITYVKSMAVQIFGSPYQASAQNSGITLSSAGVVDSLHDKVQELVNKNFENGELTWVDDYSFFVKENGAKVQFTSRRIPLGGARKFYNALSHYLRREFGNEMRPVRNDDYSISIVKHSDVFTGYGDKGDSTDDGSDDTTDDGTDDTTDDTEIVPQSVPTEFVGKPEGEIFTQLSLESRTSWGRNSQLSIAKQGDDYIVGVVDDNSNPVNFITVSSNNVPDDKTRFVEMTQQLFIQYMNQEYDVEANGQIFVNLVDSVGEMGTGHDIPTIDVPEQYRGQPEELLFYELTLKAREFWGENARVNLQKGSGEYRIQIYDSLGDSIQIVQYDVYAGSGQGSDVDNKGSFVNFALELFNENLDKEFFAQANGFLKLVETQTNTHDANVPVELHNTPAEQLYLPLKLKAKQTYGDNVKFSFEPYHAGYKIMIKTANLIPVRFVSSDLVSHGSLTGPNNQYVDFVKFQVEQKMSDHRVFANNDLFIFLEEDYNLLTGYQILDSSKDAQELIDIPEPSVAVPPTIVIQNDRLSGPMEDLRLAKYNLQLILEDRGYPVTANRYRMIAYLQIFEPPELDVPVNDDGNVLACPVDESDKACCPDPTMCAYEGMCYPRGSMIDIDYDGIEEECK